MHITASCLIACGLHVLSTDTAAGLIASGLQERKSTVDGIRYRRLQLLQLRSIGQDNSNVVSVLLYGHNGFYALGQFPAFVLGKRLSAAVFCGGMYGQHISVISVRCIYAQIITVSLSVNHIVCAVVAQARSSSHSGVIVCQFAHFSIHTFLPPALNMPADHLIQHLISK